MADLFGAASTAGSVGGMGALDTALAGAYAPASTGASAFLGLNSSFGGFDPFMTDSPVGGDIYPDLGGRAIGPKDGFDWAKALKIAELLGKAGKDMEKKRQGAPPILQSTPPRGGGRGGLQYRSNFADYLLPYQNIFGIRGR